ncbi:MAG: nitroreductase [Candidatus Cybelea sp.]
MMKTLQSIEVLNAIYSRRAIRRYTAEPVGREVLEELVNAAIQAPSARGLQPWGFAVVMGSDLVKNYSVRAERYLCDLLDGPLPHPIRGLGDEADIFHGASALVVVCATSEDSRAAEDCCLAAQNLMLAAFANGLGTCPIGLARPWLSLAAIKSELGIPQGWRPVFPIVVGFPDEEPESRGRRTPEIVWKSEQTPQPDAVKARAQEDPVSSRASILTPTRPLDYERDHSDERGIRGITANTSADV